MTDEDVEVTAEPKIATNALTPRQLLNAHLDPAVLDATNLNTMASTSDGRASLGYVIECALAAGHSVTTNVGGIDYTFQGLIGLADGWTTTALTTSQQQFVTSCTLARVNYAGVSVSVSLRGSDTTLAVTAAERRAYIDLEGGFFGNAFGDSHTFYVASCKGTGPYHSDRLCAGSNICGFDWRGSCTSVCGGQSDYFMNCTGSNGTTYPEVVTTYLVP